MIPEPELSAERSPSIESLRRAVHRGLLTHRADLGARVDALALVAPQDAEVAVLRACGMLFLGRASLRAPARTLAVRLLGGASRRDRLLAQAAIAWADDEPDDALRALARAQELDPNDAVATKVEHGLLFVLGRSKELHRCARRAIDRRDPDAFGHGALLGCLAFACVETGELEAALRYGAEALEREPEDAWGAHAVAHVFDRVDDPTGGLAHLDRFRSATEGCGVFSRHVEWHRAVFLVELGRLDEALALYDDCLASTWCENYRDASNRASLLWYLEREGVEVGARWVELAQVCEPLRADGGSAFALVHCALASARAGIDPREWLGRIPSGRGHQARVVEEVGLPVARAIAQSLFDGDSSGAVAIRSLRNELPRLGGSRAQRDLFDRIAIDLAFDSGATPFARALIEARLEERPRNAFARRRKWAPSRRERR